MNDLRADYLAELERSLRLPEGSREEVVAEVAAYIDDALDAGLSELAAVERLGPPVEIARPLNRQERIRRARLAAIPAAIAAAVVASYFTSDPRRYETPPGGDEVTAALPRLVVHDATSLLRRRPIDAAPVPLSLVHHARLLDRDGGGRTPQAAAD